MKSVCMELITEREQVPTHSDLFPHLNFLKKTKQKTKRNNNNKKKPLPTPLQNDHRMPCHTYHIIPLPSGQLLFATAYSPGIITSDVHLGKLLRRIIASKTFPVPLSYKQIGKYL